MEGIELASPELDDLPLPPAGRTGWPWTESTPVAELRPGDADWPVLTIITPTLNQGEFLEATIRSVLLQGYPRLEYIVLDGGSNDNTRNIISRYAPWLSYWTSEPDRGQSDAINKGIRRSTGEIFNWLNSDDYLTPGALLEVGQVWQQRHPAMLVGRGLVVDASTGATVQDYIPRPPARFADFLSPHRVVMSQPSTFLDLELVRRLGGLRDDLHYVLDWELYLRLVARLRSNFRSASTRQLLSIAVYHSRSKTSQQPASFRAEAITVLREMQPVLPALDRTRVALHVQRQGTQQAIFDTAARKARASDWLKLLRDHPDALVSRPFWGALRRHRDGTRRATS